MKRKFIIIPLFLLLLFTGGGWYLLCTEAGLHRLFKAAARFVPGELTKERVRGRLIGPLEVAGLSYRSPALEVTLDQAEVDWEPLHLFLLQAKITRLEAEGIRVVTKGGEVDEEPVEGIPEVSLPIGVVIDHATVRDIVITPGDGGPGFPITRLSLGAEFHRDSLHIRNFKVDSPRFTGALAGTITTGGSYPLDLSLTWSTHLEGFNPVRGEGTLSGTLEELEVVQDVTTPARVNLTGTLSRVLETAGWEGTLTILELTLADVGEGLPPVSLKGTITSRGTISGFDIGGSLDASDPLYGEVSGKFLVEQREGVWTADTVILTVPGSDASLEVRGRYAPLAGSEVVKVNALWHALPWPLTGGEPIAVSPEGKFSLEGSFDDYTFTIETNVAGDTIPEIQVTSSGKGSTEGLTAKTLQIHAMGGTITGGGGVTWKPDIVWDGTLEGTALDPGRYDPAWEGTLSFSMYTEGEIAGDSRKISLDMNRIGGTLRGYPVDGVVRMEIEDRLFRVPTLELRAGSALLTASGELGDTWNLEWKFGAKDLGEVIPLGRGSIAGEGALSGLRETPRVTSMIRGEGISAGDYRIDEVELQLLLDMEDLGESRLDFSAGEISLPGVDLSSFAIRSGGTPEGHTVSISATGETVSLEAILKGKYSEGFWEGTIETADISSPAVGEWRLKSRESIYLSRDEVNTGNICWVYESASLCSQAAWSSTGGLNASTSLEGIPLSLLLNPFLPEEVKLEGTLGGVLEFGYSPGMVLNGRVNFQTSPGAVTYTEEGSERITIPLEKGTVEGTVVENILDAELAITMSEKDFIRGAVNLPLIPPSRGEAGKYPLQGKLEFRIREPGLVPAFTTDLHRSSAVLRGSITIAGTLKNPTFTGEAGIEEGAADILDLGIRIEEARFIATSDGGGTLGIDGEARSNEGTIRFSGEIALLKKGELRADLRIKGERFEAVKTGEVWLLISPDMEVNLEGTTISVKGTIEIPEGTIEPIDLAGAVPISRDVVIVDETGERDLEKKWKITTRVNLVLGEKVRFDGFGLSGRLQGRIVAEDEPESVTRGSGEIQVSDGKFEAYGQKLEIERGKLIFAGGPISDPGLDVRAVRKIRNVVVGVDVSGTVNTPRLRLFSTPRMSQADTLSFLLFGRATGSSSSSEAKQLEEAAGSGKFIGGEILAREIGAKFGLEDITIEEGDTREEAALFIGTYLSPRLYVSYGVGLFQRINIYRIRYDISSRWFVQAEDGLETGADLFFKIEK